MRARPAMLALLAGAGPRGPLIPTKPAAVGPTRDPEAERRAAEKRDRKARRRAWLAHGVKL